MERSELVRVLRSISPALAGRDFVPLHTCFCFDGEYVWAEDGAVMMSAKLAMPFRGALAGATFLQLLESSRSENIEFEKQDSTLSIRMGRTAIRWQLSDYESRSAVDPGVLLPAVSELIQSIQFAMPSAGFDPSSVSRMGVTIKFEQGSVIFFATNNVTICKSIVKTGRVPASLYGRSVQLSRGFCTALAMAVKRTKPEYISLGDRSVCAEVAGLIIRANLIEGADSSMYEHVLEGLSVPTEMIPVTPALVRAMDRANILSPVEAEMEYTNGALYVYSQSKGAEIADKIPVGAVHPEVKIKIAPKYMQTLLPDMQSIAIMQSCVMLCNDTTRRYIAAVA